MSYYVLHIPIDADDAKLIRAQLSDYLEQCIELHILINPDEDIKGSNELKAAIQRLIVSTLMSIKYNDFQGLH